MLVTEIKLTNLSCMDAVNFWHLNILRTCINLLCVYLAEEMIVVRLDLTNDGWRNGIQVVFVQCENLVLQVHAHVCNCVILCRTRRKQS